MGKSHLLKLIRVSFIFIILSLSHTNVFAKSTDEKNFLKLLSEAINLRDQNNQSTIKTYKIIKKINKEFDVANINIDNIAKANFYILRCDGSELFNEDDRQKIINYCLESDAFNIKNKIYKENNYEIVEVLFAFIIAEQASIDFTYSNNKDNLQIAKKYIEKK